jgi:hypothetical protein
MPRLAWLTAVCLGFLTGGLGSSGEDEHDKPWPYTVPKRPAVPKLVGGENAVDAFLLHRLHQAGLDYSPPADKETLLRRVTFDLIGLPPTVEEQEAFLADDSPDAYERLVDRLLASPRFGERWAMFWLDLVRYAETEGFKADEHRPNAFRYRDYVIDAFNADLPYDRFVRQQIAGDELEPDNPQALIATGYNRLYPDESNAANLEQRRQEILDEITEVTGLAFLGLTLGCARCHDHKFDPLTQADHYRFQAFFAPMRPRDDWDLMSEAERLRYRDQRAAWEQATAPLRAEMDRLMADKRHQMRQDALARFRKEIQDAVLTPPDKRTPYQEQIALMAMRQIEKAGEEAASRLSAEVRRQVQELERQMRAGAPPEPGRIMAICDVGPLAPPTHVLAGGDWQKPTEEVAPGFPAILGGGQPDYRLPTTIPSTGRRAALARWLTRPDHPLTARVIVNRLWHHHFGRGIVATPSDFGKQGDPPTHPELLDWLAVELVENHWSLKHIHRLLVTSRAYRQSSRLDPREDRVQRGIAHDPDNSLLWHFRRRRLEGEALRDSMLAVSGSLNLRMHGPSCRPKLPADFSRYAWTPDAEPKEQNRRSIYVYAKRNLRYPLFEAFDQPDMHNSCGCRNRTTTAPQALLLLNGEFARECSQRWAEYLRHKHGALDREETRRAALVEAFRLAWGRPPVEEELASARRFLEAREDPGESLADLCHVLFNSNEFVYID